MPSLYIPKGGKLGLQWRSLPVIEGKTYFGFCCKHCAKPILRIQDTFNGGGPPLFVGEGRLKVNCEYCGSSGDLYETHEVQRFVASEDLASFKEPRPTPTNGGRQPISRKYSSVVADFGQGAIEQRPQCAIVLARCISYWTYVELALAALLATFLKANTDAAIAMYLSLRNAAAKRDALNSVAKVTLSPTDFELFLALMHFKDAVEKSRNDMAHGVFGISNQIPDGVVWVSTTDYAIFQANHSAKFGKEDTADIEADFVTKQFVYEVGDLETTAVEIEEVRSSIDTFRGYIDADDPTWKRTRYPQLCSEPRIKKELDRLRQPQKSNS